MRNFIDIVNQSLLEDAKRTVWGILYTKDNLFLGKRAPSVNNPNQWNFFGGSIDAGESELQALIREIYEEVRVNTSSLKFKKIAQIGGSAYYAARLSAIPNFKKTKETSKVGKFSLLDLPNNLHSKTAVFFKDIENLLK